jgi:hypothetical protein
MKNYLMLLAATNPEIADVTGLGGSRGPRNHRKRWGAKHPTFFEKGWGRLGSPDLNQINDFLINRTS